MPIRCRYGAALALLLVVSGAVSGCTDVGDPSPLQDVAPDGDAGGPGPPPAGDPDGDDDGTQVGRTDRPANDDGSRGGGASHAATGESGDEARDDPHLDVEVSLETVARLPAPTASAVTPDGVVLVASRDGTVRRLDEASGNPVVLDISAQTTTDGERGLLDLAVSADGEELYVSFTDGAGDSRVDAFAFDESAELGARRTVFTHPQPYANHNGGGLQVTADGMLYLGLGDGGGAGDPHDAGQDLTTALGSLVRIDPGDGDTYGIPDDNPFVGRSGAAEEIFAYGLRNPWRFTIDQATGQLWIADVGQGTREEVNRIGLDEASGANFGWNRMEGTARFSGDEPADHVPPVYEYETHADQGCAITGGLVYRGSAIPDLRGAYLYADFCDGELRGLVVDERGEVIQQARLGAAGTQVVGFGRDAHGEVLVLDLAGEVLRLVPG